MLRATSPRTVRARPSFAWLAGLAIVATVGIILTTKDHTGDDLRRAGAPLSDSLDAYTHAHRACPATLEAIGLTSPQTKYGPFTYRTWENATHCEISVGVYARDGFEEYWLYPPGDWYSSR